MEKNFFIILTVWIVLISGCSKDEDPDTGPEQGEPEKEGPVAVEKTNPMRVYVHYMPWFETPESSSNGNWGIHWTMASMNPENMDSNGKREIASHFYPKTGPYASGDDDVIEYHLLLMKYAGIDGLIIDWYGSYDLWDFPDNRENAEAVIEKLDDVGLSFALTYEDWTLNPIVSEGKAANLLDAAKADFSYMEEHYFGLDSYIEVDGNPLLTVFGPQVIQDGNDWTNILNSISETPTFFSLWYESGDLGTNASGEFAWVYEDNSHISNFYDNQKDKLDMIIGSAYPGFKDFYEEGNWDGAKEWIIEHNNGSTLDETLEYAMNAGIDVLQLVTWNDFGEGTMIEPTDEFGYAYLEKIQNFTGVSYSSAEFEYIFMQYELRKNLSENASAQKALDRSFDHFVKLKVDEAKTIIDSLNQL